MSTVVLRSSSSFCADRQRSVTCHETDDMEALSQNHVDKSQQSASSLPTLPQTFRKTYSQLPLKEALNIQQYSFVKECSPDGTGLQAPSSRRRHSSLELHFRSTDATLPSQELVDAMKQASISGKKSNQATPLSADADILASMHDDAVLEQTNAIVVSDQLPPAMIRGRWSIQDYTILRSVHKGYASDVYEATCNLTGKKVALKAYVVQNMDDIPRVQLAREIRLHAMCNHPNIVQFYAAFVEEYTLPQAKPSVGSGHTSRAVKPSESCRMVILVVEWAGRGDLSKFMKKQGGRLSEAKAVNLVLLPLLKCLHYLHSKAIVHRDIKPENIIFDNEMVLKMADFGLSLDLNEERANTRAGTLDYMAPEVLMCPTKATPADFKFERGARHYTTGADAWAIGAIFYELLVGLPPFRSNSMSTTARHIVNCDISFPPHVSSLAKKFISSCLRVDPSDRPTVVEMMENEELHAMKERAQFRIAAKRSNSFVEFIEQQHKQEQQLQQRQALIRQCSQGVVYLDSLIYSPEEDVEEI